MRSTKRAIRTSRSVLCVALAWAAGFVSLSLGELESANDYGEELVALAHKHGLRPFHAAGLCIRGSLAAKAGKPEAGIAPLRSGLAEMQTCKIPAVLSLLSDRARRGVGHRSGRFDEGLDEIDEALRFAVETDYRWFVPEILRIKGELLRYCAVPRIRR